MEDKSPFKAVFWHLSRASLFVFKIVILAPHMVELIGVVEVRFVLALALAMTASIYKDRTVKTNLMLALAILYTAFGLKNTTYLISSVLFNLALMRIGIMNQYTVTVVNILNIYVYKALGHYMEPRIRGTFDITGFLITLTLKMGYLVRDYDRNVGNSLDYLFFIPGLLTGPTAPYKDFVKRDRTTSIRFPTLVFLKTTVYIAIHMALRSFPLKDGILDPKLSFGMKLVCLYLFNLSGRMKYHFAWGFAHCCFILNNLPGFLNIDFVKVEFTESVREISSHWNKFVSAWLKEMFFLPLKDRSMGQAVLVSHLASAALHGLNPCYLIFSLSFGVYSHSITKANELLKYKALKIIQMAGFVSYFSMPFYLLSLRELYMVWKSVYFYGHIYCTFWLIYFNALKCIKSKPMPSNKSD